MRLPELVEIDIGPAETLEEVEAVRQLRAETYVDHGFLSPGEAATVAHDKYDNHAVYFPAYRGKEIVGGSRLIPNGPEGLFFLENFDLNARGHELVAEVSSELVEVSGMAVPRGAGGRFSISAGLYRAMGQHTLAVLGSRHWVAVVDPALHRILAGFLNIIVLPIGESRELGHRERTPVYVDLVKSMEHLRANHPEEHEFFASGLAIDLRQSAEAPLLGTGTVAT
ncbi:MAG: hypothetical protein GY926_10670 [bacterium]|nr:hypothetical protein [bacterium]